MTREIALTAALTATAALLLLLAGLFFLTMRSDPDDRFAQCRTGRVADGAARVGGPFTLVDKTGATVTDREVIDRPALLYFGYTFCPDVCPLDVSRNAEAVEILEGRGRAVKPVFVSVDPARDTPEAVAGFVASLHPRMVGLTGSEEQVRDAARAYRVWFKKQDGDDEYYLVDHTTLTYLSLPEIGFVAFFRRDLGPEQMADRVECFVDAL